MTSYRISTLAELSGVPATTLRYYEDIGLLSPAERTSSGYRLYGDAELDRLRFISAAKLLGLSLEEIRELLTVWERGVCANVRELLAPLIGARMTEADQRIAELTAFCAHLARIQESLHGPAPAGACRPGCGCVPEQGGPVPMEFLSTPPASATEAADPPVACTLSRPEHRERLAQWHVLLDRSIGSRTVTDGVVLRFPPDGELAGALARLAAAEQQCCAFFGFALQLRPEELELRVTAPAAARPLLQDVFGVRS